MYSIIVWHNSATEGTHQRVLMSAKPMQKVMRDFAQYMERPEHHRSFNSTNLIQLHHAEKGVLCKLPSFV
jgi:hypothetical protein